MVDEPNDVSYPERPALIADVCRLLKAARRPLTEEWERFDLDREGWNLLDRLTDRLVRHLHFEHLDRKELRHGLRDGVRRYKNAPAGQRPANTQFAADVLDGLAQQPMPRTVYLGVRHLKLPHGTTVGDARFLQLSEDDALAESFAWCGSPAPELVCEVEAIGGTDDLLLERARKTAERALALVRQQMLFGCMSKIYLDQVMFGLDGRYSWRAGSELARAGWWNTPAPMSMDLAGPQMCDWRTRLDGLSADYLAVAPGLRERIDVCLEWLDVAARSDRWPIIVPATFSAMEAILVPEKAGLKAGVVTVRSIAVHIAVDQPFFDPGEVMAGYQLRSDLVHGTPTPDVLDKEATAFAEFTRRWAFDVFRDYLTLVKDSGAGTVTEIAAHLDRGPCNDVCSWLEEHGGSSIVAEYRESLKPKDKQSGPPSPDNG
jgi:hypothetical protein